MTLRHLAPIGMSLVRSMMLALLLFGSSRAETIATDPMGEGGCWPTAEAMKRLASLQGRVLFRFEGTTLLDEYIDLPRRHLLVEYRFGSRQAHAVLSEDKPLGKKPGHVCTWLHHDDGGVRVSSLQPGVAGLLNPVEDSSKLAALTKCVTWRDSARRIRLSQLSEIQGRTYSGERLEEIRKALMTPEERSVEEAEEGLRNRYIDANGDLNCDRFGRIVERQRESARKLVALMPMDAFPPGQPKTRAAVFALFTFDPQLYRGKPGEERKGWSLYEIDDATTAALAIGRGSAIEGR